MKKAPKRLFHLPFAKRGGITPTRLSIGPWRALCGKGFGLGWGAFDTVRDTGRLVSLGWPCQRGFM